MIKNMYRVTKFGKEWHVEVYRHKGSLTTRVATYVLGRNDGRGPRHFKMLKYGPNSGLDHIPLPKKFANAMLAWVTMRGET